MIPGVIRKTLLGFIRKDWQHWQTLAATNFRRHERTQLVLAGLTREVQRTVTSAPGPLVRPW
ncbi:MAG: hypothetical protein QOD84_436 [Acidobacteriaceae bacterium]|jgi:hypothetical protein